MSRQRLENLESRRMFAVSVNVGLMSITGTGGDDEITVGLNKMGSIVVNDNGTLRTFTPASVTSIGIDTGAGDDNVRVSNSVTKPCTINGGTGQDVLQGGGG